MTEGNRSLEGWVPETPDEASLRAALEKAFDYRGDVTCELADGSSLVGYLFNRNFAASPAYIEVYPAEDGARPRRLELAQINALRFSGRDMADGRSWEAWVARQAAEKAREAAGDTEG